jgi:hypothetical protein
MIHKTRSIHTFEELITWVGQHIHMKNAIANGGKIVPNVKINPTNVNSITNNS